MKHWKGRFVTEKRYNKNVKVRKLGQNNKKQDEAILESQCTIERLRIFDAKFVSGQMFCTSCKSVLSFEEIEKECRRGLASIFLIRCRSCLLVNRVVSGKTHTTTTTETMYDINSRAALGKSL